MKILGIDHIGVAAKSINDVALFWNEAMGLAARGKETIEEQHVTALILPVGESQVELLESTTPDGAVAKFIDARGEGIQHIALRVDNLDEALNQLREKGVQLIDETPRKGAGDARIAFIHPKSTHGILLELVERSNEKEKHPVILR